MGYDVKPAEVDVPADEPFRNDRLDRRQTADALSQFVGMIDGPCVVGLDAAWGMGKTTFLRMWQADLRRQCAPVVMFNAWDNDFANEPFLALSEELREALGEHGDGAAGAVGELKAAATDVLVNTVPTLGRVATTLVAGSAAGEIAVDVAKRAMSFAEQDLSLYGKAKKAMAKFRAALTNAAEMENARAPLVVLIDELDRCRPSYAVELLEVLKHLFAVKGVVFVLAVNRRQLEHSVRVLYGAKFDAAVYLRRFFDVDLRLPAVDRAGFIEAQLDAIWVQLHTIRGFDVDGRRKYKLAHDWITRFFSAPELDLRTVQQALGRLGLLLAMLRGDPGAVMLLATFTLILRTRDHALYDRFVAGDASHKEVADTVFGWVDPGFRDSDGGIQLEAVIIVAAEMTLPARDEDISNRLFSRYRDSRTDALEGHIEHWVAMRRRGEQPSFRDLVRRLELVSGDVREGAE